MIPSQKKKKRERRQFVPTTHFLAVFALVLKLLSYASENQFSSIWEGTGIVIRLRLRDPQVFLWPTDLVMSTISQISWNTIFSIILCVLCLRRQIQNKYEGNSATCCGTSNIPSSMQVRENSRSWNANRMNCSIVNNN